MTREKASEMFPVWASGEAVRILDEPEEKPEEETPWRLKVDIKK